MLNKLIQGQKISILYSRNLNRFFNITLVVFMLVYNFSNWCQTIGLSSSLYYLTDENTIHKHAANLQSKKDFVF